MRIEKGRPQASLQQVLRSLKTPVLVLDDAQVVHSANPAAGHLLGRPDAGLIGSHLSDLVSDGHSERVAHAWRQLVEGAAEVVLQVENVAYDLVALRDDGAFTGAVVSCRPASGPTNLLEEALGSAPLCLIAFDGSGVVTYAGGSSLTALGVEPVSAIGQDVVERFGGSPPVEAAIRRCLAGEEIDTVLPYAGRVWDLHYRPVLDGAGKPTGGLCMAQDVTDWLPAAGRPASPVLAPGVAPLPGPDPRDWTPRAVVTAEPAVEEQLRVVSDLRKALAREEVSVDYQPVVRVQDRTSAGVEALVRWEHPTRGRLLPADFLALAESTGLLLPMGERVLRQACHAVAGWNREATGAGELQVSVNVSARQLLQPGLAATVREALVIADCRPSWLLLEVTEATLTTDQDAAAAALRGLKGLGVDIALDDAGTGEGSSTYLRRFPFDQLKIDRSFVSGLGADDGRGAIVAALVSTARSLGVRCAAEGVETAAQLAVLQDLGCDLAQGYLFSRPMPYDQATSWLARAGGATLDPGPAAGAGLPVATTRRVLELHAEGASLHTIAARLNLEGRTNSTGRRWHHTSVARFLAEHQFPGLRV